MTGNIQFLTRLKGIIKASVGKRLPLQKWMSLTWVRILCSSLMMGTWWQGFFDLVCFPPLTSWPWTTYQEEAFWRDKDPFTFKYFTPRTPSLTSLYLLDDVNGSGPLWHTKKKKEEEETSFMIWAFHQVGNVKRGHKVLRDYKSKAKTEKKKGMSMNLDT